MEAASETRQQQQTKLLDSIYVDVDQHISSRQADPQKFKMALVVVLITYLISGRIELSYAEVQGAKAYFISSILEKVNKFSGADKEEQTLMLSFLYRSYAHHTCDMIFAPLQNPQ